jgi:PAS domain S-box-containing protein
MGEALRILILEDNPADLELIRFELEEGGFVFTLKAVMTEKDFVRELQEFSPDLILSDYDLPTFNGALALIESKRRCPDVPFILVTGAIVEDRAIEILTQGAKDYVLKNRLEQRFVPAVRRALAEAEEHRARKQAEAELREAYKTLEERVRIRTAELEAQMAARKKTEEELRESESVLRAFFNSPGQARGVIEVVDGDIYFISANKVSAATYGLTPEAMRGKSISELDMTPKMVHAYLEHCEEAIRSGLVSFEVLHHHADISRWLLVTASYLGTGPTGYPRFAFIVFNVTERKRSEEILQKTLAESEQNRAFLEAVISAQNDALVMYDRQRNVQRVNPIFIEIYGFNPTGLHVTEVMQRVSCRSLNGRPLILEEQPTPQALAGKKMTGLSFAVTRADGSEGIVEVSSGPIQQGNNIIGAVTVWHDVTERKKNE